MIFASFVWFKWNGDGALPKLFHLRPAYTLNDVAEDVVLLMDQMNIPQAHISGGSMGGMLAQTCVVNYPARFISLASVMSNTGGNSPYTGLPDYPLFTLFYLFIFHPMSRPPVSDTAATIQYAAEDIAVLLGKARSKKASWNHGLSLLEEAARRHHARMLHSTAESRKGSMARQVESIMWQLGDRKALLGTIEIPTVVVHGMNDTLIPMESGIEVAKAIGYPACRKVVLIPDCGHSMDDAFSEPCVAAIVENCKYAEGLLAAAVGGRSKIKKGGWETQ